MQTTAEPPRKSGRPRLPRGPDGEVVRAPVADGENPAVQRKINRSLVKVTEATIQAALSGEVTAQRLLLERGVAARRPVEPKVVIPGLSEASNANEAAKAVRSAVASGLIAADDGKRVLEYLKVELQLIELDGMAAKLAEMYRAQGKAIPRDVRVLMARAQRT